MLFETGVGGCSFLLLVPASHSKSLTMSLMSQQMIFLPQRELIWWKKVEREPLGFSENVQFFQKDRDLHYSHAAVTLIKNWVVVFWVSKPRSKIFAHRRFGGTYCLHLQDRNICHYGVELLQVAGEGSCYLWRSVDSVNQEAALQYGEWQGGSVSFLSTLKVGYNRCSCTSHCRVAYNKLF